MPECVLDRNWTGGSLLARITPILEILPESRNWANSGARLYSLAWLFRLNLQAAKNKQLIVWWRRRESNPRPKSLTAERLHAQSGSIDFALCAQNRQDAHNPSPEISLLRLGPGRREPACCMTSFRGPQTKPRRTATYLIKQLMPVDCWQLLFCERLRVPTPRHASILQSIPSKP